MLNEASTVIFAYSVMCVRARLAFLLPCPTRYFRTGFSSLNSYTRWSGHRSIAVGLKCALIVLNWVCAVSGCSVLCRCLNCGVTSRSGSVDI